MSVSSSECVMASPVWARTSASSRCKLRFSSCRSINSPWIWAARCLSARSSARSADASSPEWAWGSSSASNAELSPPGSPTQACASTPCVPADPTSSTGPAESACTCVDSAAAASATALGKNVYVQGRGVSFIHCFTNRAAFCAPPVSVADRGAGTAYAAIARMRSPTSRPCRAAWLLGVTESTTMPSSVKPKGPASNKKSLLPSTLGQAAWPMTSCANFDACSKDCDACSCSSKAFF
mmetsp:Transcript_1862/g.4346  ORF Transcript_1862/g.4346 Transcript_1862/m.4346 type:complete len:238 (+) Transcript_1862:1268-1981(+)